MNAAKNRRRVLELAARVDADPRTVRKYLDGKPVVPAIARALDEAVAADPNPPHAA